MQHHHAAQAPLSALCVSLTTLLLLLQEWVTATAGLAADQLLVLLRDAAARHMPAQGGNLQDCFLHWKQAVQDVHSQYFKEYDSWQTNLQLPVSATTFLHAHHYAYRKGLRMWCPWYPHSTMSSS